MYFSHQNVTNDRFFFMHPVFLTHSDPSKRRYLDDSYNKATGKTITLRLSELEHHYLKLGAKQNRRSLCQQMLTIFEHWADCRYLPDPPDDECS